MMKKSVCLSQDSNLGSLIYLYGLIQPIRGRNRVNTTYSKQVLMYFDSIKLRYYEMATKFEKNLPPILTKQLFLLSSVKKIGGIKKKNCGLLRKAEL